MSPLVSQGLDLAMYGMGVVFVFLTLLVLATMAMSRLVMLMGDPEPVPAGIRSQPSNSKVDKKTLAAITAAVHQHRTQQR